MKYNLKNIMKRAWEIKRTDDENIFSLCLKMAWAEVKAIDTLLTAGANRWQKGGHDRLYLRNAGAALGFVVNGYYKSSGRINGAELDGESISNSYATEILNDLDGMYIDLHTMKLYRKSIVTRTCMSDRVTNMLRGIA